MYDLIDPETATGAVKQLLSATQRRLGRVAPERIGLSAKDIAGGRRAISDSPKIHAALAFVAELIDKRGTLQSATRDALIGHGWTQAEIGEMVGQVALNVFSNYFKQVAEPALDFPAVPDLLV